MALASALPGALISLIFLWTGEYTPKVQWTLTVVIVAFCLGFAFALREQSRKRPRRRELEPLVVDALKRAGLYDEVADDLDRPALRLSGGQQQRLCIARAIAPRPEVLLMDEPCSALDPISTNTIEKLIGELRRDLAVVVVTHNLAQAHRVADKVAFMYLGDLVEYGSTSQVFDEPRATRTRDYVRGAFG